MEKIIDIAVETIMTDIKDKLLTKISEKYNIPLNELMDLLSEPKIKAIPKSQNIKARIKDAKKEGKFYNVTTKRPIADNPSNRKKYAFIDELSIAGLIDSPELESTLKLLGKKGIPFYVKANEAKKRGKQEPINEDNINDPSMKEVTNYKRLAGVRKGKKEESKEEKKPMHLVFNSSIDYWINPDTKFVIKRYGIKHYVIGKLVGMKIKLLSGEDIKICQKFGWKNK